MPNRISWVAQSPSTTYHGCTNPFLLDADDQAHTNLLPDAAVNLDRDVRSQGKFLGNYSTLSVEIRKHGPGYAQTPCRHDTISRTSGLFFVET
jgi:hypothetical protein